MYKDKITTKIVGRIQCWGWNSMNEFDSSAFKPSFNESENTGFTIKDATHHTGDIFDLANAFLNIASMSHKKLQKLCFYAKAWYLALYDTNLIDEPFEAWVHGAVQPELHQKYKIYGFGYIPRVLNVSDVPEEFLSFAREIYDSYGELSGDELEELNHTELPWLEARESLKPWQNSNNIISENTMKEFYRKMM